MDVVQGALEQLGFGCRRLRFGEIENLYARRGTARPNFCFAGHTDVVPVGDSAAWTHDPFGAQIEDDVIHGRGAADMKSAIAAFIAAVSRTLQAEEPAGSISLLITGDEEGVAEDGTKAVVRQLATEGEEIDHCVVGEPTSSAVFGDMIKIGRRGSINAEITVEGVQGHVAYPQRAANPTPVSYTHLDVYKRQLKDLVERFVADELMPLEAGVLTREAEGKGLGLSPAEHKRLDEVSKTLGLWGLDAPEDVGGVDLPNRCV